MREDKENSLIRNEIGEAVLAVLVEGKIVSVETIITHIERKQQQVSDDEYKRTLHQVVDLLIRSSLKKSPR
jgi:hypothetical protein